MSGSAGSVMNIFRGDAFSTIALTMGIQKVPYMPVGLGNLRLFGQGDPIRNKAVMIEQWQGQLVVIPMSERGSPPTERVTEKRQARYFECPRLAHGDTIMADELQNVRAFDPGDGTPIVTELMQLQQEAARRLAGPEGLQANLEYTRERHRLSTIQGVLRDADDTIVFNWFQEFGIAQPTPFVFNLAANTMGTLRPLCNQVSRAVRRASKGAFTMQSQVMALCGDNFWDGFINHPDVRQTYLNWAAAEELRTGPQFDAFGTFKFGDILWFNYRGSDDTTTIAVASNSVHFFPENAPGVFKQYLAPAEFFPWVNQPGKKEYVIPIIDHQRNAWFRQEIYSYPLFICTRPEVLQTGTMDSTADIPNEPNEP